MTSNKIARLFGAATVVAAAAGVSTAQADTLVAFTGTCPGGGGAVSCSALISPADTLPNIPPGGTFATPIITTSTIPGGGSYNFTATNNTVAGLLGAALAATLNYTGPGSPAFVVTSAAGGTEWAFTFSVASAQLLSVIHDDGVALFGASGVIKPNNETTDAAAIPQSVTLPPTLYSLAPGTYTLYYVSSNALPEVLQTTLTPIVPLPGTAWLFGAGLAGLGLLTRRRRNSGLASAV